MYTPVNPSFTIYKSGVFVTQTCFRDVWVKVTSYVDTKLLVTNKAIVINH